MLQIGFINPIRLQLQRQKINHADDRLRSLRRVFDEFFIYRSARSSTFNLTAIGCCEKVFVCPCVSNFRRGKKREDAPYQLKNDALIRRLGLIFPIEKRENKSKWCFRVNFHLRANPPRKYPIIEVEIYAVCPVKPILRPVFPKFRWQNDGTTSAGIINKRPRKFRSLRVASRSPYTLHKHLTQQYTRERHCA